MTDHGRMVMKLIVTTIVVLAAWIANAHGQVVVIANKSVPVDTIKKSLLLDFYTRDIKQWSNGQSAIVFDLKPQGAVKTAFYDFLGKSPSRMKSEWLKKMLSGEGDPPEAMNSEEDVLTKVAETAGALGFISNPNSIIFFIQCDSAWFTI